MFVLRFGREESTDVKSTLITVVSVIKKILILIVTYLLASLGFGTGFVLTSSSFVSPSSCFLIFLRTGTASALTSADSVFSAALCDILFSNSLWMAFGGGSGEGSFLFGGGFA